MLLKRGDKVHVLIRRRFEKDIRRHMIGLVEDTSENSILVEGRKAIYNGATANYSILEDTTLQVVPIIDSGIILTVMPEEVELGDLYYETSPGSTVLTDGKNYRLRINEVGLNA